MTLISKAADRMLSLVAPKLTAGACCTLAGKHYTQACFGGYCKDYHHYQQNCVVTCDCGASCGPCYVINDCG